MGTIMGMDRVRNCWVYAICGKDIYICMYIIANSDFSTQNNDY